MQPVRDKVVFITGAGRGVGRATALAFAESGANLLLTDVCNQLEECPYPLATREQLDVTASRCRSLGRDVVTAVVDVRFQDQIDAAITRCRKELGIVDVLVNNAGLVGPAGFPSHEPPRRRATEAYLREPETACVSAIQAARKALETAPPAGVGHREHR